MYLEENDRLKDENLRLTRKLQHATEKIATLERERVQSATEFEIDDERQVSLV